MKKVEDINNKNVEDINNNKTSDVSSSQRYQYKKSDVQNEIRKVLESNERYHEVYTIYEDHKITITNLSIYNAKYIEQGLMNIGCSMHDFIENVEENVKIFHYIQQCINHNPEIGQKINDYMKQEISHILPHTRSHKHYKNIFILICGRKIYEKFINEFARAGVFPVQLPNTKGNISYFLTLQDENKVLSQTTVDYVAQVGGFMRFNNKMQKIIDVKQLVKEGDRYTADCIIIDNEDDAFDRRGVIDSFRNNSNYQSILNELNQKYKIIGCTSQRVKASDFKSILSQKVVVSSSHNNKVITLFFNANHDLTNCRPDNNEENELYENLKRQIVHIRTNFVDEI